MKQKSPVRIQRKRTKGWRTPENTVYVGRGSRWGNRFTVEEFGRIKAINNYKLDLKEKISDGLVDISILKGKNLSCWCPLDKACHGDVLIEMANPVE